MMTMHPKKRIGCLKRCFLNAFIYILLVPNVFFYVTAVNSTAEDNIGPVYNVTNNPMESNTTKLTLAIEQVSPDSIVVSNDTEAPSDGGPVEDANTINATKVPVTITEIVEEEPDCTNNTCVRKCCPEGKIFSFRHPNYGCVDPFPNEPKFKEKFQYKDGRPASPDNPVLIITGQPHKIGNCTEAAVPNHRTALLLRDGSVHTHYEKIPEKGHKEYCIEIYRPFMEGATKQTTFTCFKKFEETPRTLFRFYAHAICLIMSITALSMMVLFHVFIPKLRDFQGLCLLSHICSLLVGNIALVTASLSTSISDGMCVAIGMILYCSFLATFMWVTVMCFDIWRYIRQSIKGIPSSMMRWQKKQLFMIYSGLVWGAVTLLTIITSTLHFLPEDALPDYIIRPHFGVNRCFIIEEDANLLLYLFLISGSLCLANVVLVSMTVYYLHQGGITICCINKKTTDTESSVFNAKHLEVFWQRFQIFGLTILIWTTEVLSWKIPPKEMWELTDLINTLQGVFIFLIFMRAPAKREMVYNLCGRVVGHAQSTGRRISTLTSEISTLFISNFVSSNKLEGSDKETIIRIRKLSNMEECAASTIVKTISSCKIELVDLENTETTNLEIDNASYVDVDLE